MVAYDNASKLRCRKMDIDHELNSLSIELLADHSEDEINSIIEQAVKSTVKLEENSETSTSNNLT